MSDGGTELREKLTSEVLPCDWPVLRPHHAREALFLVSPDLDLVEAALAIATNRADRVEVWLTVGRLGRPTDDLLETLSEARFQFLIVQPFVLAQPLPAGD